MKATLAAIACLSLSVIACGNPIAIIEYNSIFIAEERLTVRLSDEDASLQCAVTFRDASRKPTNQNDKFATIWLPVWLPEDYRKEDIKRWKKLATTGWREHRETVDRELGQACGLKVQVNGRPLDLNEVGAFVHDGWEKQSPLPPEAFPKRFHCIVFIFNVPKTSCRSGCPVTLSWRQPHASLSRGMKDFFYLPLLPVQDSQIRPPYSEYSRTAHLRCDPGMQVFLSWGKDGCVLGDTAEAVLPLVHLSPLKLSLPFVK